MPRRKIGADLKEALCKLYEAGDISADTIEKHGIMSRATFFRNLKMYKTGASLEQRHSTGRKTNADKLKEQERQELDSLQPSHLSQLELVSLFDDDVRSFPDALARNKRKAKATTGSSKRREIAKSTAGDGESSENPIARDDAGSDSDDDSDEDTTLANRQVLDKLALAARSFLTFGDAASSSSSSVTSRPGGSSSVADLDSLLMPEDSHYSPSNRGALYIVRRRTQKAVGDLDQEIVAAIALRSLIWTPQIYQALGSSYASRSIDKICNLAHLRVDPIWQRKGIGRWLVSVAELKAAKLGFSHLYTQCDIDLAGQLSFWRHTGFSEFARLDDLARLEKMVIAPKSSVKGQSTKRAAHSSLIAAQTDPITAASSSTPISGSAASAVEVDLDSIGVTNSKQQRTEARLPIPAEAHSAASQSNPTALEIDPAIPQESAITLQSSSNLTAALAPTAGSPEGSSLQEITPSLPLISQTSSTSTPMGPNAAETASRTPSAFHFPANSLSGSR